MKKAFELADLKEMKYTAHVYIEENYVLVLA